MRTLDHYIDRAREKQGFTSDNQLGRALDFAGTGISFWRTGKGLPSDEKMVRLAKMAGIDEKEALIELNIMRSPAPIQKTYASILQRLSSTTLAICIIFAATLASSPAQAGDFTSNAMCEFIYYGNKKRFKKSNKIPQLLTFHRIREACKTLRNMVVKLPRTRSV